MQEDERFSKQSDSRNHLSNQRHQETDGEADGHLEEVVVESVVEERSESIAWSDMPTSQLPSLESNLDTENPSRISISSEDDDDSEDSSHSEEYSPSDEEGNHSENEDHSDSLEDSNSSDSSIIETTSYDDSLLSRKKIDASEQFIGF
ncbi:dentin sialophosphoprotein-like, partial [Condylostylus longicornis]|uniref:dentin sialophosphoprotein-like n=1 Tax=Condylostylus longicornis TaxID=2530218 RepID=UPI00244E5B27